MAQYGNFWHCFLATSAICLCSYFTVINYVLCNNLTSVGLQWISNNSHNQSATYRWSFFYSSFIIGAFTASLPSSFVAESIGRKKCLLLACPFSIIGSVTTTVFIHYNNFYLATVGRLLLGMAIGLSRTSATLWIIELAPTAKRGFFLSFEGILYYLGDLVAYVVSLPYLFGNENRWAYSFLLSAVLQFFLFPVLAYLPESPRYIFFNLTASQDKLHKSIGFYHGTTNLNSTLEELEAESHRETTANLSWSRIFRSTHRRSFLLSILIYGTVYFGGITTVLAYSTEMFEAAGISHFLATHLTVVIALIKLPLLLFPLVIERIGRRPLSIFSNVGCGFISLLLVLLYWIAKPSVAVGWWTTILIFIQSYFQQVQEIMAMTVAAEILSEQSRSKGLMMGNIGFYVMGTFLTYIFLPMTRKCSMSWALTPYAIVPLLLAVIMWWSLPETPMRTFGEIIKGSNVNQSEQQPLLSTSFKSLPDQFYGTSICQNKSSSFNSMPGRLSLEDSF